METSKGSLEMAEVFYAFEKKEADIRRQLADFQNNHWFSPAGILG